jgi:hypothetical protein
MRGILLRSIGVLAALLIYANVQATAIQFQYSDTVSLSEIAGVSVGDAATITFTFDNGNTTSSSQVWNSSHLQSATFDFGSGELVTTFDSPFDGSLSWDVGIFVTDGAGSLTSVMTNWGDQLVTSDYLTNGVGDSFNWILNGSNFVYTQTESGSSSEKIYLTNVNSMLNAANWTQISGPTVVPIPAAAWLFGSALLGLGWLRRKT